MDFLKEKNKVSTVSIQKPDIDVNNNLTIKRKRLLSTIECMDIKPTVYLRDEFPLSGNSLILNNRYDYVIVKNENGDCCLLPLHKNKFSINGK